MTQILKGGCLCGAVRLELQGAPYRVGLCHCMDCRKKTGGIFSIFAIYPVTAVTVTGAMATHPWGGKFMRHFCPDCGSPLYQLEAGSDEAEVFLGVLDEPNRLAPSYELWTVRREAWLPPFPLARHFVQDREGTGRSVP
jgi:hypothetical protein